MGIIGGRPAKVRVVVKENTLDRALAFMEQVVATLEIDAEVTGTKVEDGVQIEIEGAKCRCIDRQTRTSPRCVAVSYKPGG